MRNNNFKSYRKSCIHIIVSLKVCAYNNHRTCQNCGKLVLFNKLVKKDSQFESDTFSQWFVQSHYCVHNWFSFWTFMCWFFLSQSKIFTKWIHELSKCTYFTSWLICTNLYDLLIRFYTISVTVEFRGGVRCGPLYEFATL